MTGSESRHAEVARIANEAHARNERARTAVMDAFDVTRTGAAKLMCAARKAGHDIASDSSAPMSQGDRYALLLQWLSDGREFDPMPWRVHANCRNVSTSLFFPGRGDMHTQRQAVEVCRGCSVRSECFDYGFEHYERGVWGGTTERQRRQLRAGWLTMADIA